LFVAGTETTTSTIRWILFHLIKYPKIQQTVHEEIDRVLGEHKLYPPSVPTANISFASINHSFILRKMVA